MKTITHRHVAVGFGILLAGVVYVGARARAAAPSNVPIVFTGSLMDNGQALIGSHQVAFDLWDDSTATDPAFHVCSMPAAPVSVGIDGFVQIPLSTACQAGIPTHPSLWYEFTVDGKTFPRTAIGAVPFAYWAGVAHQVLRPVRYTLGGTTTTSYISVIDSFCGMTAPTNGSFSDPARGTVGLQASKTLCESACSSTTAHICLPEDLDRTAKLLGGTIVTTKGWVEVNLAECQSETCSPPSRSAPYTAISSLNCVFTAGVSTPVPYVPDGRLYEPNGGIINSGNYSNYTSASIKCDTVQPILCCD